MRIRFLKQARILGKSFSAGEEAETSEEKAHVLVKTRRAIVVDPKEQNRLMATPIRERIAMESDIHQK